MKKHFLILGVLIFLFSTISCSSDSDDTKTDDKTVEKNQTKNTDDGNQKPDTPKIDLKLVVAQNQPKINTEYRVQWEKVVELNDEGKYNLVLNGKSVAFITKTSDIVVHRLFSLDLLLGVKNTLEVKAKLKDNTEVSQILEFEYHPLELTLDSIKNNIYAFDWQRTSWNSDNYAIFLNGDLLVRTSGSSHAITLGKLTNGTNELKIIASKDSDNDPISGVIPPREVIDILKFDVDK